MVTRRCRGSWVMMYGQRGYSYLLSYGNAIAGPDQAVTIFFYFFLPAPAWNAKELVQSELLSSDTRKSWPLMLLHPVKVSHWSCCWQYEVHMKKFPVLDVKFYCQKWKRFCGQFLVLTLAENFTSITWMTIFRNNFFFQLDLHTAVAPVKDDDTY